MQNRNSVAIVAATALCAGTALADVKPPAPGYPARPIRIIVANTAGSATDVVTRLVAQRLSENLGRQAVVDNRPGASGIVGHEIAARAAPDGYTLLVSTSAALVIVPLLNKVPYDPVRDFAPVSLLVMSPQMLVGSPSLAARTVGELVALARAKPGQLNCASPGYGTSNHLGCELLKTMASINFLHVPYKGTSPAITDVMAGQAHFMFNSMPAVYPLAKAGKLRAIAHGGARRSPAAPEVPTVAESIPGFQCGTWYALMAPAGTPPAIVARVNAEIVKLFADPPFAQRIMDQGQEPAAGTPVQLAAHMSDESRRWSGVIKQAGLKSER
jgi:tripartite-type tricarboxylate transporter receptor subunit TctC